jgi:hypothetical protein
VREVGAKALLPKNTVAKERSANLDITLVNRVARRCVLMFGEKWMPKNVSLQSGHEPCLSLIMRAMKILMGYEVKETERGFVKLMQFKTAHARSLPVTPGYFFFSSHKHVSREYRGRATHKKEKT